MNILLLGANGRLGQKISEKFSEKNIHFVPIERIHTSSFENFKNFIQTQKQPACILDVSLPEVTYNIANYLLAMKEDISRIRLMVGTTGHSQEGKLALTQLSHSIPICLSSNFSKGVFLFGKLLQAPLSNGESFAAFAKKLGFRMTLTDAHHKHKKDSPSGTAIWLNQWLNIQPEDIASIREGEIIGEHTVNLESKNETLKISHEVTSRDVFADGACDLTIQFFEKKLQPGLYSVNDIWE